MVEKKKINGSYTPSEKEKFMSAKQLKYFKQLLSDWKDDLLQGSSLTINNLKEESSNKPDNADRASIESERSLELRTRDRERKLIIKIDQALQRVDDGLYGYCEDTGEPIGIKRLEARPIATLCIEAQERHERLEKSQMD